MDTFDESYAKYLNLLAKLDETDDVAQKNLLFRQLIQLLCDLEQRLKSKERTTAGRGGGRDELRYRL